MRKSLIVLLIGIHLLGNTETGQLFKLPALLQHYFQHHRQDQSISFFEFLNMHYSGDDGTTADDDTDKQLPCHNFSHTTFLSLFSPMASELIISAPGTTRRMSFYGFVNKGHTSKHVLLILQPPRFL